MTSDEQPRLGIDELVEAMCMHVRYRNAHPDLQHYWSQRYASLRRELGLSADPLEDRLPGADDGVDVLLRRAAQEAARDASPFAGFLEAGPVVVDLYRQFGAAATDLTRRHHELHRAIARACLAAIDPGLADRTCTTDALRAAGVAGHAPDPLDYL